MLIDLDCNGVFVDALSQLVTLTAKRMTPEESSGQGSDIEIGYNAFQADFSSRDQPVARRRRLGPVCSPPPRHQSSPRSGARCRAPRSRSDRVDTVRERVPCSAHTVAARSAGRCACPRPGPPPPPEPGLLACPPSPGPTSWWPVPGHPTSHFPPCLTGTAGSEKCTFLCNQVSLWV